MRSATVTATRACGERTRTGNGRKTTSGTNSRWRRNKFMKKVLLTAAGGSGTLEIISSLKGKKDFRVIGLDASPYSRGLSLCDAGYVVPFAADKRFKQALLDILKKEKPDFIIPLVDEEILLFHELAASMNSKAPKIL